MATNSTSSIRISYPPDYDGQTDVSVVESAHHFEFRFSQGKNKDVVNPWEALVLVARAIVAQDDRLEKIRVGREQRSRT